MSPYNGRPSIFGQLGHCLRRVSIYCMRSVEGLTALLRMQRKCIKHYRIPVARIVRIFSVIAMPFIVCPRQRPHLRESSC